jgi:hypothetical protein
MFLSGDTRVMNWGCSRCKGNAEGDAMREERGCDKDSDYLSFAWAPELKRCPWSQVDRQALSLWNIYQRHKENDGMLTLLDEPAWVWQAVTVCGRVAAQWHATSLQQALDSSSKVPAAPPRR